MRANRQRIAVASTNRGKLQELSALLAACDIELIGQAGLRVDVIPETGLSFVENALLKARHLARHMARHLVEPTPVPVLADDSGLVVPALDGAPGLYSARFSSTDASGAPSGAPSDDPSDDNNNRLLLQRMQGLDKAQRRAWFHCTLVCLHHASDPDPLIVTARWHGHIARQPAGEHGFGYDPLFIPAGQSQSAACMSPAEKSACSHRGQALRQLLQTLPEWL